LTVVIVCGYGKNWYGIQKYVWHALDKASNAKVKAVIFSGGDTTNESTGGPWEFKTEAEVMGAIAKSEISITGKMTRIILEEKAYNTLTNMLYSKKMIDDENEKIIIVCNEAHLLKVRMAAIKVFGLKSTQKQISFFQLTTGEIENLKILIKTIPEVLGYFIRPIGRRIEYEQWRQRTGRNEQLNFKQFCQKFRNAGELL
jgi:uncharacterized SAM-binding protein YcdF (DUF218 family)